MDGILGADRGGALAQVEEVDTQLEPKRPSDRGIGLERGGPTVLDRMQGRNGQTGPTSQLAKRPTPSVSGVSDLNSDVCREARGGSIGLVEGRHSLLSEQVRPYRTLNGRHSLCVRAEPWSMSAPPARPAALCTVGGLSNARFGPRPSADERKLRV